MSNQQTINVEGTEVALKQFHDKDYLSLTDMANWDNDPNARSRIQSWLKNGSTVRFLELWEQYNNPGFNYSRMDVIKTRISENAYVLTAKRWIEETHAIGIQAKAGRYGGTYAHRDIAFEFGMAISPAFKLILIREFQRLKAEWSISSSPLLPNSTASTPSTAYNTILKRLPTLPLHYR